MSLTQTVTLDCPECGATLLDVDKALTVNADRHPELREQILKGTFQQAECACGVTVQLAPQDLTYQDVARKQWIVVQPNSELSNWRRHEATAEQLFERVLGSGAPAVAQEIGEGISPRVVFGWAALREKLIAEDMGLKEVFLECMKLSVIKNQGIMPQAGHDFRLTGAREGALLLEVIDVETQRAVSSFGAPRSLYDEIASKPGDWARIATQLSGAFLDLQRLFWGD